ncbi:MAG: sigma factor-like helix-turn-helix DNA-binding protein [Eubacteriales bacterium]|nr:sigma factor-like helix-turn-helix DNA-binding protein [Eubacteriales bacterium]
MTLADAITRARSGERDGFVCLFDHTIPHVWLAAAMLGCSEAGTAAVQIYRTASEAIVNLRSPSDMRVWIGSIAYPVLLEQAEGAGLPIHALSGRLQDAYHAMAALPQQERAVLLLLCGEGCSAPQAAQILSCPDIEIKRAMRRARQTIAAQMKQAGYDDTCNTAWLISVLSEIRAVQMEADRQTLEHVLECIQTGAAYQEPEPQPEPEAVEPEKTPEQQQEEKGGFFQRLFRSRRFG